MTNLDDAVFEALREELRGRKVHSTHVTAVDLVRGTDAEGAPALFVNLRLTDPPPGEATWPTDDVRRLRLLVRDAVLRMLQDEALRWYVTFESDEAEITIDP